MNTNKKNAILPKLNYNNRVLNTPTSLVSAFNEYFSTVADELNNGISRVNKNPLDYLGDPCPNSFYASPCTPEEVKSLVLSLPTKGCCTTSVPIFIYKKLIDVLGPPICDLFNASLTEGSFPDCLKVARVVLTYKSEDKSEVSNYRPISTLSVLSKLFERLMYKRLISFINANNLICGHQFGFRMGYCTNDAVIEFLDYIYNALNNKMNVITVYLDFSKAFDTVNHEILCLKLQHSGIRGLALNWFKSYLTNRKQYVSLSGCNSTETAMTMGVPQGSILGPALFLIYINDMYKCSPDLNYVHFADDTTIFVANNNEYTLYETINKGLSSVNKWLKVNRLSLNIKN